MFKKFWWLGLLLLGSILSTLSDAGELAQIEGIYSVEVNPLASQDTQSAHYPAIQSMALIELPSPKGWVAVFIGEGSPQYVFTQCKATQNGILEGGPEGAKLGSRAMSDFKLQLDLRSDSGWGWIKDSESRGSLFVNVKRKNTFSEYLKVAQSEGSKPVTQSDLPGEYAGTLKTANLSIQGTLVIRRLEKGGLAASFVESKTEQAHLKLSFPSGEWSPKTVGFVNQEDQDNPMRMLLLSSRDKDGKVVLKGLLIAAGTGAVSRIDVTAAARIDEPVFP